MIKKITTLIGLFLFLMGCATSKSPSDFVEGSKTRESFCYDIETEIVEKRIHKFMSGCYAPIEAVIPDMDSCKTQVNLSGLNGFWRRHFLPIDKEAQGQVGECFLR